MFCLSAFIIYIYICKHVQGYTTNTVKLWQLFVSQAPEGGSQRPAEAGATRRGASGPRGAREP